MPPTPRGRPRQLPRRAVVAEARKASLTTKSLYVLQTPFLLVFQPFQSQGLAQHPSRHCRLVEIARCCLGDICPDTRLDYSERGYQKGVH